MKLPLKISLGASFISIVFMMFLFYNIHNQLTTFKKDVIVHEYNKELESLKNTTDLILEKAKNTLSLITIADSNSKRLLVKLKHRFEFYMSSVKEIKELRFVSIDGEELVVVSKDKLYLNSNKNSFLNEKSFKLALVEEFYISDIYFTESRDEMSVDISKKVKDINSDKIIGVIIAKLSISDIQEMMGDKLVNFDGIALLDTNTNNFLYKSNSMKTIDHKLFINKNKNILNIIHNSKSYLIVSSKYNNLQLNMKFFFLISEDNMFSEIYKTIRENLQLLFIMIIILSLIVFFLIEYMLKPLKILINDIKLLSNKIDKKFVDKYDNNLDEVKELTLYFDGFVKLINSDREKLNDYNINLQQKVKLEVQKNNEKEQMLFQQSKMAAMGEMIGNIAHQWRQPISIISMWANNIVADIDMEDIKNENLRRYANNINEQTNHLSKTIDDFRNFFTPNKEKTTFTLKSSIDKTMNLLSASFKTHSIEVIKDVEDITITALENELTQAILNIIKNAKDILITLPKGKRRLIFIDIYKKNNQIILEIKDSGGGVPKDIIDKVFEPYFTTKHKSQGTGIGLYMSYQIISNSFDGDITVANDKFSYKNKEYTGAEFSITIPL